MLPFTAFTAFTTSQNFSENLINITFVQKNITVKFTALCYVLMLLWIIFCLNKIHLDCKCFEFVNIWELFEYEKCRNIKNNVTKVFLLAQICKQINVIYYYKQKNVNLPLFIMYGEYLKNTRTIKLLTKRISVLSIKFECFKGLH